MSLSAKLYSTVLFVLCGLGTAFCQSEVAPAQPTPSPGEQITLFITVSDRQHHSVNGLSDSNFKVYESGQLQPVQSVKQTDSPICMGLLVDNSGSMRPKRAAVIAALREFIKARAGTDHVFVVNFNDQPYMDQDLTNDIEKLNHALDRADARGGTALYDALIASANHLMQARACGKRALVLVTDGKDNESRSSLEKTVNVLSDPKSPLLYALALAEGQLWNQKAQQALETLTNATGGKTYFIDSMKDMKKATSQLLEEFSDQYTLVYTRADIPASGSYRNIKVEVSSPELNALVRTRAGIRTGARPGN